MNRLVLTRHRNLRKAFEQRFDCNMTAKSAQKEKIFHPKSRKAGQVERAQLRKAKLEGAAGKRAKRSRSQSALRSFPLPRQSVLIPIGLVVDIYVFFYHAMPPDCAAMSLDELHAVIRDVWLTRHDVELNEEVKNRRKGNPKSAKQSRLENMKAVESEVYRTGIGASHIVTSGNQEIYISLWTQRFPT